MTNDKLNMAKYPTFPEKNMDIHETQIVDPQNEETESNTISDSLKTFSEETTAHGPAHITHAPHKIVKLLWIITVLAAVGILLYHLISNIIYFFSYPAHEQIQVSQNNPTFPFITICNQNAMSTAAFLKMVQDTKTNVSEFNELVQNLKPKFKDTDFNDAPAYIDDFFASPVSYYENIGLSEVKAVGHKFNDFVLSCTFSGIPCDEEDFDLFVHPVYFNCYTFTGNKVKKMLENSSHSEGPFEGLSLVVYLESEQNPHTTFYDRFSTIGNAAGTRIQIHSEGTYPTLDIHGLDAMAGQSTSIAFKITESTKLSTPYGNCSHKTEASPSHTRYKYSSNLCFAQCAQEHIQSMCNCSKATLPFYGEYGLTCGSYYDIDKIKGISDSEKLVMYVDRINSMEREWSYLKRMKHQVCDCTTSCLKTSYLSEISSSKWPADQYHTDFFAEFVSERKDRSSLLAYKNLNHFFDGQTTPSMESKAAIFNNFARINVYLSDLETVIRQEVPSFTALQLLSDIGGTLGLWAGFSVITCIEIVSLLVSMTFLCCRKSKQGIQKG